MVYLPRSAFQRRQRKSTNRNSSLTAALARPSLLTILFTLLTIFAFAATFAPASFAVSADAAADKKSEYGTVIGIDLGTT